MWWFLENLLIIKVSHTHTHTSFDPISYVTVVFGHALQLEIEA